MDEKLILLTKHFDNFNKNYEPKLLEKINNMSKDLCYKCNSLEHNLSKCYSCLEYICEDCSYNYKEGKLLCSSCSCCCSNCDTLVMNEEIIVCDNCEDKRCDDCDVFGYKTYNGPWTISCSHCLFLFIHLQLNGNYDLIQECFVYFREEQTLEYVDTDLLMATFHIDTANMTENETSENTDNLALV